MTPAPSGASEAQPLRRRRATERMHTPKVLTAKRLPPGGILFGPLVVLVIWELASAAGWLSPKTLAAPSTAVVTGYELITDGVLADHFLASAKRAYLGLGIGVTIGLVLALI